METTNIKDYEDCIGKQVKGFKFDSRHTCSYASQMDNYIGVVGTIIDCSPDHNIFGVEFVRGDFWYYPADLVIKQLEQKEELVEMMEKDEEARIYDDSEGFDTEPNSFECASCEREKPVSERTDNRPNVCNECLDEEEDVVNNPSHYTDGKIEVIDFIEDKKLGFHLANAVKYISRAGKKDPSKTKQDIDKAIWYLERFKTTF